ncbi:LysR family transcriptional regulator [Sulfitobacter sp. SK012]|uniref:LysR family transcriptional regulator n=1 Tax=Sulfitobacter sp. SK012 TaxID=1389005 RepID=UPI000E0B99F4|nr:LysR family transcriptional regulator [Sulfitobacter sp. SK012]AXI46733.1 LysR family transcriptional regulator [Sulfitobacter sp. SK012]
MLIDPRHLQILTAIVDAGGLTEGAARLGKSQPSLSRSLALLEARIGAPLFEKGKRPLQPTALGRALAVEGRVIASASEAAGRTALSHSKGQAGILRVAGSPVFMDGVISQTIASFQAEFPDLRVDQSYGYLDALLNELSLDQIDIAICPVTTDQVPEGFSFRKLLPGRNVIACSSAHPLARKKSLILDDIAPYPWIAPPADSPLHADLRRVLDEIGISDIKVSFSGGSLTSILNVLEGSQAITILPHSVVFMQRHTKKLHPLSIRIKHPARDLGLLTRNGQQATPAVRRLEKHLIAQFSGLSHSIAQHERNALWRS